MARKTDRTNSDWETPAQFNWDHVMVELLMDIRQELRYIASNTQPLRCHNLARIPRILDRINANTRKKKRKPKPVTP